MSRVTFAQVNAALAAAGHQERLVQGRGYLYFIDGDAFSWYSQSIMVCKLNHLKNPIADVLRERDELASATR